MNWNTRIARISGIDVKIHWTFYLLLGFAFFSGLSSGLGTAIFASVFLLAAFFCVVLHEFGHAFDVDQNGRLDLDDADVMIHDILGTVSGDVDLNQTVDFADFLALAHHFGNEGGWAEGDFNGDRVVDFSDFLILTNVFGRGSQA